MMAEQRRRSRRSTGAYVHDGRLVYGKSLSSKFSRTRCVIVAILFAILVATNPSNVKLQQLLLPPSLLEEKQDTSSWISSLLKPIDTNFVIFTLSKSLDGISVKGLMRQVEVCDFGSQDYVTAYVCEWIGDVWCHGKPLLDDTDFPYTANRVICWLLLASMILFFCSTGEPVFESRTNFLLDSFLSVLDRPSLIDLLEVNWVLHPTLVAMSRLIQSHWVVERYKRHFWTGCVLLVFGAGGIANGAGTFVTGQRVHGIKGALAAALGYQERLIGASSSWSLFFLIDVSLNAASIFWFHAITILLNRDMALLVTWFAGAAAGHAFATMQRQHLEDAFATNVTTAFRRVLRKFF